MTTSPSGKTTEADSSDNSARLPARVSFFDPALNKASLRDDHLIPDQDGSGRLSENGVAPMHGLAVDGMGEHERKFGSRRKRGSSFSGRLG